MEGLETIEEVSVGDTTYTMLKASLANEVINRLNLRWEVSVNEDASESKFIWSRDKIKLELAPSATGGTGAVAAYDVWRSGILVAEYLLVGEGP